MKIEKSSSTFSSFQNYYNKQQAELRKLKKRKSKEEINKKEVDLSKKLKEDNIIGWA